MYAHSKVGHICSLQTKTQNTHKNMLRLPCKACVREKPVTHMRKERNTEQLHSLMESSFLSSLSGRLISPGFLLTSFHDCLTRSPTSHIVAIKIPWDPSPLCLHQTQASSSSPVMSGLDRGPPLSTQDKCLYLPSLSVGWFSSSDGQKILEHNPGDGVSHDHVIVNSGPLQLL